MFDKLKLYWKYRKARKAVENEAKAQGFSVWKMLVKGLWSFLLTAGAAIAPLAVAWAQQPENVQQALADTGWSPGTIAAVAGLITAIIRVLLNADKNLPAKPKQ